MTPARISCGIYQQLACKINDLCIMRQINLMSITVHNLGSSVSFEDIIQ